MIFLAERLRSLREAEHAPDWKPLVLMGSEIPFPFRTRPSRGAYSPQEKKSARCTLNARTG